MRLCLHLVDTGCITAEQALNAIRHQMAMRPPIGQLAVEAGLMKMSQVFDVMAHQIDSNRLFGQLAVDLGYITQDQLGNIILKQLDSVPSLASILIKNGSVTPGVVALAEENQRMAFGQSGPSPMPPEPQNIPTMTRKRAVEETVGA
ncbi:MAG: hypothetical protein HKN47_07230 [Pirellulaceae bacterium]|nr:hypothetical protein [Pirellulaceae bacterium]